MTIIVTGAASGIGRATAERLLREGKTVAAFDRDAAGLARLREAGALGGDLRLTIEIDIADEGQVQSAVRRTVDEVGPIAGLVNSAGIDHLDRIADCSFADWRRIMSVNLDGTFLMCREVVRHMAGRGSGKIVNVASWLAKSGMAGHGPYSASKFGMIGLTQSLAKEVAAQGICVNAVCPGAIDHTRMREEADLQSEQRGLLPARARIDTIPMGRLGEPEDVAGVILFLLSSDADYMTGQAVNVTGGLWMN
ncbi:SDR family NAD(P)-dependent oxidoreductase [Jiella sonneratiae]|uniref:SDR family oxidoreductase n=1 Tax=Jiella sonneratiae TaxID=2816856 RepID=A0ABS3J3I1_9HYPH|nr:SDR family oxidoreductase [Jiella sonneratiae]MBO0904236.1 SDR family oxidoreductase [Jiella sonneratiae]